MWCLNCEREYDEMILEPYEYGKYCPNCGHEYEEEQKEIEKRR